MHWACGAAKGYHMHVNQWAWADNGNMYAQSVENYWSSRTSLWVKRGQVLSQVLLNGLFWQTHYQEKRGSCWKACTNNPLHYASTAAFSKAYTRVVTLPQTQSLEQTSVSGGGWVGQGNYCANTGYDSAQCCVFHDTIYNCLWESQLDCKRNICKH